MIKEKGPELMRRLVTEVGAAVDEYRHSARVSSSEIGFEPLPGEGFCVTKVELPSVSLECRPDYEMHVVYGNMTRTDHHESHTQEFVFSLDMVVDDSAQIMLRHQMSTFPTLDAVVEFLLKPVLFPPVNQDR